jgi:hypothetical protein
MAARWRTIVLIVSVVCVGMSLAACSSTGDLDLDPSTWFPDGKKKLPGERREVFPGGVPGVTQGVPPELIRGSPQQQAAQNPPAAEPEPAPPPAPKAASKSRPKKVARPAQVDPDADEPPQPAARAAPRPVQPAGGWPAPQPQAAQQQPQQQPPPANSAWPAPPGAGTFTR